ncbi:PTS sugar transporter subunit IIC [Mycoplasma capricolum]|uniref:PTS sugar transporter subunit IIC n=1 Tax=Mycoplasma capricolum TaxID=2095 RepID=UPI003DA38FB7
MLVLVFFTIFSYYVPKGKRAMSGLSGAVCATFLIEVFNFWVLGRIPVIGDFTKVIGSVAGTLAAPACTILVIILMGGNPLFAILCGTAVFAVGLSVDVDGISKSIARTLVNTSNIEGQKLLSDDNSIRAIAEWVKGNDLGTELSKTFESVKSNLIITDQKDVLKTIFNKEYMPTFAMNLRTTVGAFNILAGLVAGYTMYWALVLLQKYAPDGLDLIIALLVIAPSTALIAKFGANVVAPLLKGIGSSIEVAINLSPIPMAIVVGGFLTVVGTSPLSSMALAVGLGLQGSAMAVGSVSAMGSSFMNGVLFARMKYGEKKQTIACSIEPLSQADIISMNPVSVYITNFIGAAATGILVIIYGQNILNIEQTVFMINSNSYEVVRGFTQQGVGLATPFGPVAMFGQGGGQTAEVLTKTSNQYATWQLNMHLAILLVLTAILNVGAGLLGGYMFRHSRRTTYFEIYNLPLPLKHQYLLEEIELFQDNKRRFAWQWQTIIFFNKIKQTIKVKSIIYIKTFVDCFNKFLVEKEQSIKTKKEELLHTSSSKKEFKNNFKKEKKQIISNLKNKWVNNYKNEIQKAKQHYKDLLQHYAKQLESLKKLVIKNKKMKQSVSEQDKVKYQSLKAEFKKIQKQKHMLAKSELKGSVGKDRLTKLHNKKMQFLQDKIDFYEQVSKFYPQKKFVIKTSLKSH